jgi:hypothetical protein
MALFKFKTLSNEDKALILYNRLSEDDKKKVKTPYEWSHNFIDYCFEFENINSVYAVGDFYNRIYRYNKFLYDIFKI